MAIRIPQADQAGAHSRRATIADLAAASGVSVATVDRVLNRRLPVREATARRVLEAAESLGYHAAPLLRSRVEERRKSLRAGFLLQKQTSAFYLSFAAELIRAAETRAGQRPRIEYVGDLDPQAITARMLAMADDVDALAVVSVDHPHVTEAIRQLKVRGLPTFTLLSDLSAPDRAGYVGLDPRKAGRTAAWAITRMASRPGTVAIFVGSHRYFDHDTREISLRSYLREHAPAFSLLEPFVDLEQPEVAHEVALTLFRRHPDLVGIYSTGLGTDGIMQAMREAGNAADLVFVCNELTAATRAGLIDGVVDMVIGTPVGPIADRVVEAMLSYARDPDRFTAAQMMLPFDIHGPENI
jgi:LacI family transcriptional regulator